MAAFPAIGKLLMAGFGELPQSALHRSEMESGPPKQAKFLSRVMVTRPLQYQFTPAEYDSFTTFFKTTLGYGADWFDWIDPRDGVSKQARIVGGDYRAEAFVPTQGDELHWRVAFNLETWG